MRLRSQIRASKGFLIDALDLEGMVPQRSGQSLKTAEPDTRSEMTERRRLPIRCPKVRKSEFNADPERYVLRPGSLTSRNAPLVGVLCQADTAKQEYVWLVTKIIRDERLNGCRSRRKQRSMRMAKDEDMPDHF